MKTDRIQKTASKISEFLLFQSGWHYGSGKTPEREIVNIALTINDELAKVGFAKTNAFLGIDGEIMVTAYHDSIYFEVTIEANKQISFLLEQDDIEIDYEESTLLNNVRHYIRNLREKLWSLSGSSIKVTTIPIGEDLQVLLLNHQVMEVASPSLIQFAFLEPEKAFANTLKDTIEVSPGNLQFSGISTRRYSQANANSRNKRPNSETTATIISPVYH